jgi:hypothetical protein
MKRWILASGLLVVGCGAKTPPALPPTPTATVSVSVTQSPTPVPTVTVTTTATATPSNSSTPVAVGTPDEEYDKLSNQAVDMTLGKGYQDALPLLQKALTIRPDDPKIHFYMMICLGNLEDSPTPKSEAYAHAQKVIALAPTDPMADRARDYVAAAESEPKKPRPDLDVPPIEGGGQYKLVDNGLYKTSLPGILLESNSDGLDPDLKKHLWWSLVHPATVPDKIALPKGTKVSIHKLTNFFYSKNTWRGGEDLRPDAIHPPSLDQNSFDMNALQIFVEEGPLKGKAGWMLNQLDRFKGVDSKNHSVWDAKFGPVISIDRGLPT